MRRTTISEAKNGLSALIDLVRSGERVVITDRGRPVARLEPITAGADQDGRLARLERAGLVRPGSGAPPLDLLRASPPRRPRGPSAVDALLDERRHGR